MALARFQKFLKLGSNTDELEAGPHIRQEHRDIVLFLTQALEAGIAASAKVMASQIDDLREEVGSLKEGIARCSLPGAAGQNAATVCDSSDLLHRGWHSRVEPVMSSALAASSSKRRRERAKRTKARMWSRRQEERVVDGRLQCLEWHMINGHLARPPGIWDVSPFSTLAAPSEHVATTDEIQERECEWEGACAEHAEAASRDLQRKERQWKRACIEHTMEESSLSDGISNDDLISAMGCRAQESRWHFLMPSDCSALSVCSRRHWNIVAAFTPIGDTWRDTGDDGDSQSS